MAEPSLPRFYVASSEPAGAIGACACGNFLGSKERNLAVARKDQLDIMGFTTEGLKVIATTRLITAVTQMRTIRPSWSHTDLLFVLHQNFDVLILELSMNSEGRPFIQAIAAGSVEDKVGRLADTTYQVAVDPQNRCIALHINEGLVRIIPLKDPSKHKEIESFSVRVEEHFICKLQEYH